MAKTAYQLRYLPEESIKAIRPNFSIDIAQQPIQARACGSTKSFAGRRSIDPPPIVKVCLYNKRNRNVIDHSYNYLIMTATAELMDQNEENLGTDASKKNFKKRKPNLEKNKSNLIFGTTTVAANVVTNSNDSEDDFKAFFVFSDISVRYEGYYRLNFRLWEFPLSNESGMPGSRSGLIYRGGMKSEIFKVYNAKYFPGLTASPELTLTLKSMGSRIRVRKSNKRDDSQQVTVAAVGPADGSSINGINNKDDTLSVVNNLKVLSEISSAIRQLPPAHGAEKRSMGDNSIKDQDHQQQSQTQTQTPAHQNYYYNQPGGYQNYSNASNQFYMYNYLPQNVSNQYATGSVANGAGQANQSGMPIPSPNVIASATQTASAAVSQQQQELKATDDENIDDEFKQIKDEDKSSE
ncbi:hypothetical protein DASC09_008290 [Saccharomycopsis crataegensis]|uniref:Velvet domain-containing protein n=1 Tax=Saccharomycopsis crataegensis TaxID=43959 RepID=A0AAV5QFJ4_9ASCO|nr:hypothetical protein DASC09_008290 [Saccharomycopsis crataegensis]